MQIYVLKIILVKFLKQWILIMEPTWCYRTSLKHSKWSAWSDCPWSWTLYDEIFTLKRSFPMFRGWRLQHGPPFIIWQKNQASNSRTDKAILGEGFTSSIDDNDNDQWSSVLLMTMVTISMIIVIFFQISSTASVFSFVANILNWQPICLSTFGNISS